MTVVSTDRSGSTQSNNTTEVIRMYARHVLASPSVATGSRSQLSVGEAVAEQGQGNSAG